EQSYLPAMLDVVAYDTICHEHLEYYCLRQIKWLADRVGLKIIHVSRNETNGGSFAVAVSKIGSVHPEASRDIAALLQYEEHLGLDTLEPFARFRERVARHRDDLRLALANQHDSGR